jgi:hypothetical protein
MFTTLATGSSHAHRTIAPRRGSEVSRLLTIAAATLLLTTACGPGAPIAPTAGTPRASGAISIPTGNLPAYVQCMLDGGFKITAVLPGYPGQSPGYEFGGGGSARWQGGPGAHDEVQRPAAVGPAPKRRRDP